MDDTKNTFYIEQSLTHIVASSQVGKTSLAVSLISDALVHCGKKVLYFSPGEENTRDIRHRMVAAWREYTLHDISRILENPRDIRHKPAQQSLMATFKLPLIIREEDDLSFEQFRKRCLWHAHYDKIDLIMVDDFHLIKGGEQKECIQELQRISATLQIPCIVFTPLPRASDQDLRRLSCLNIRLGACAHLGMLLRRPVYEVNAELEIIKSIGFTDDMTEKPISLSFNPRSGHFTDIENIGMHLALAGTCHQECSL